MANNGDVLVSEAQWFLRERGLELSLPTIRARLRDGTLKPGASAHPMTITHRSLERMAADPAGYRRRFQPGRKSRHQKTPRTEEVDAMRPDSNRA